MKKIILLISFLASLISFAQDGSLDTSFSFQGTKMFDTDMKLQPDGKIILVERTYTWDDIIVESLIRRLNSDGSFDATFAHGIGVRVFTHVKDVAIQSDGKIIICGDFFKVNDDFIQNFARLNQDGSLDFNFSGKDLRNIETIAIEPSGKIIVAGSFPSGIIRLSPDGIVDPTFNSPIDVTSKTTRFDQLLVKKIVLLPENKILAAGRVSIQGSIRKIFQLNSDGGLDDTFAEPLNLDFTGTDGQGVLFMMKEKNGSILIGWWGLRVFTDSNATIGYNFIRLDPNGNIMHIFHPFPLFDNCVLEIFPAALQSDGKIIVNMGVCSNYYGNTAMGIARLNNDGSFDDTFTFRATSPNEWIGISKVVIQPDDKILVAGEFNVYDGVENVNGLIRLNAARLSSSEFNGTVMHVYPNPVADNLHLQFPNDINEVEIYDITMKKIDFKWLNKDVIDVSDFSSGVYLLKVKTDYSSFTTRFIKR